MSGSNGSTGIESLVAEQYFALKLQNDPTLAALVGDRIHADAVPEFSESSSDYDPDAFFPCIVVSAAAGVDAIGNDATPIFADLTYLVKVVDVGESIVRASQVYKRVHQLVNQTSGPTQDGAVLHCYRLRPYRLPELAGGVPYRHLGGYYRLQTQSF